MSTLSLLLLIQSYFPPGYQYSIDSMYFMYFTTIRAIFKSDRIFKHTKIKPRTFLELVETIHKRVSVNVQLSGCLRYVQIILKEFVDGGQRLLIEIIRRFSLKNLTYEHLTERNRQLIDQSSDPQSTEGNHVFLPCKDLAHVQRQLGFPCMTLIPL